MDCCVVPSIRFARRALGGVVFSDPEARARLEGIVWPEIARLAEEKATTLWKVWWWMWNCVT